MTPEVLSIVISVVSLVITVGIPTLGVLWKISKTLTRVETQIEILVQDYHSHKKDSREKYENQNKVVSDINQRLTIVETRLEGN